MTGDARPRLTTICLIALVIGGAGYCTWNAFQQRQIRVNFIERAYADFPANPVRLTVDPDEIEFIPAPLPVAEWQQSYGRYFTAEFLATQGKLNSAVSDDEELYRSEIFDAKGTLGSLFINQHGKVVLAAPYSSVTDFSEGLAAVGTMSDNDKEKVLYGYLNRTGQLVIPALYESASPFHDGLAAVQKSDKWGFINRRGDVVVPFQAIRANSFSEGFAQIWLDHQTVQMIDTAGKVVFQRNVHQIGMFSEGLCYVEFGGKDEQTGYLNRSFQLEFSLGHYRSRGRREGHEQFHDGLAAINRGLQLWGFLDRTGHDAISPKFFDVSPFSEGLATVSVMHGLALRTGYINRTGQIAIGAKFLNGGSFSNGLAPVLVMPDSQHDATPRLGVLELGRWGYIDPQGNLVIAPRFYKADSFHKGLARIEKYPGHHGFINPQGDVVWEFHPQIAHTSGEAETGGETGENPQMTSAITNPKAEASAKVALVLSVETPILKLGDIPKFQAELFNRDDRAIVIVLPRDGSPFGARTPVVRWSPRMRVERKHAFLSRLRDDECVILLPGESVKIGTQAIGWPTLNTIGTHRVVLEIENIPGLIWTGIPPQDDDSELMDLIRRSTPFKATSEPVEIEVID